MDGMASKKITKAIFPVAGSGTRLLPATRAVPKEMLPVAGKPLIQYAVEEALAAGIEEIIFVTGNGKHAIEDHFAGHPVVENANNVFNDREPVQITYTRQQQPLGLGHAVRVLHIW